ncbi:MAG: CoA transferase [Alphaproteobacteria bacterium]|nr:CoA transferase [Alphaproteobacteria bacterium]MDE1969618.1 CoA transferase [Alphaproteobacteria bacterium]
MAGNGPLHGITVLDLSRILAGPYCTFLMAELGARIIKVEAPPKGDDAREYGPFRGGKSTYFSSINRGKQSIALDLKNANDKRIFETLLAKADVLVENFRPGTMEKLGYGWTELHRRYPRLIYAAASGFGHSGPWSARPAYDMVVQGLGGMMSITGNPGQPPVRVGMSIGDIGAGLYAAVAINAAIVARERTGQGVKVDVAMFDCQLALLENAIMRYTVSGEIPGPLGARHPTITPFEAFATADGYVIIAAGNDVTFGRLAAALGKPAMAQNPDYASNEKRLANQPKLKAEIESVLKDKPTVRWLTIFEQAGIPAGPINSIKQALEHPQVEARNMLVTVDDPKSGALKLAGNPMKISGMDDPPTRDPAPDLDADRAAILKELGL